MANDELAGVRTLLVEDDLVNQKVAIALLQSHGAIVDVSDNGESATQLARAIAYDLILMDLQLPGIDGMETTRHIREAEELTGISSIIIAMTAHAGGEEQVRQCLKAGMDGFITKPLNVGELVRQMTLASRFAGVVEKEMGGAPPVAASISDDALLSKKHIFDYTTFIADVGEENAPELLLLFLSIGARRIKEIHESFATGESDRATAAAHKLKGAAAQYRLERVAQVADRLAKSELYSDPGAVSELLASLEKEFGKAAAVINTHIAASR
jgi:CheY-like chemotaxis protein/HPt (histidine-containing phosphotransfer) domain-containing protein